MTYTAEEMAKVEKGRRYKALLDTPAFAELIADAEVRCFEHWKNTTIEDVEVRERAFARYMSACLLREIAKEAVTIGSNVEAIERKRAEDEALKQRTRNVNG